MRLVRPRLPRVLLAVASLIAATVSAPAATSLSQFGITWTFDRDYPAGQFANGDHWVVGPVVVTAISPGSVTNGSDTLHGSMVNPAPNGSHGFDSRIRNNSYNASLNVGLSLPLTLAAGSSLLSSQSYETLASGDNPQLRTIAILTVLDVAPPVGSFRPAPVGTDKRIRWNKHQLDYSVLRSLPLVSDAPALANVEAKFERPWIELRTNWNGRYLHPKENQPGYGREIAHTVAEAVLALQLNHPPAAKEKLLIRLVQYGLDIYGTARTGARWANDGGHNPGRKLPLLLAGAALRDNELLAYGDAQQHFIFQEDQQTWYVTQSDVGRVLYTADGRPRETYIQADVGIPEWGEKHATDPSRDGRNWSAAYRTVAGSCSVGQLLAARLMGLETWWNWPAAFAYYDRYYDLEAVNASTAPNSIQPFVNAMWQAYRSGTYPAFTLVSSSLQPPSAPSRLRVE